MYRSNNCENLPIFDEAMQKDWRLTFDLLINCAVSGHIILQTCFKMLLDVGLLLFYYVFVVLLYRSVLSTDVYLCINCLHCSRFGRQVKRKR